MMMDILAESAVRVTVLVLGVAVVLRVLRIRSPGLAHRVWTAVVFVMLLLPVFVAWGPELAVPLLPSYASSGIRVPAVRDVAPAEPRPSFTAAASSATATPTRIAWPAAAGVAYVVGVGFFLLRLVLGCEALGRSAAERFRSAGD